MADTDERPAFIVDAMLGRLAKSLRMLGYDTAYEPNTDDNDLKMTAFREGRVLLTRDREIAKTDLPLNVLLIESDDLEGQLLETAREFDLRSGEELFSRCLICNVEVEDAPSSEVRGQVPEYVFTTQSRFSRCPSCRRIYWAATHVEHARVWLERVLRSGDDGPGDGRPAGRRTQASSECAEAHEPPDEQRGER
ncbi:MAG: Mut7-C RNAse domain-containing protein, partial [Candidatus Eisenbacteria sp.]|nr:Mut7-C RNAse domain-containing protein [Candidatus Eisenbacteria bacterium]